MLRSIGVLCPSARIAEWYAAQCNGDWEHSYGVKIETLDNPGWWVEIDLWETTAQDLAVKVRNDGYEFETDDNVLTGYAEPRKLDELLNAIADALGHKTKLTDPRRAET